MRRLVALVVGLSAALTMVPAAASAAGTITNGSTPASFVRTASAFDFSPEANLTGVGTGDYLFEFGWWIRVGSATAETPLPAPTTEAYNSPTSTITWTNPATSGLNFTETSQILGLGGPSGIVSTTMTVTNPTANPIELNLFHVLDPDVNGSAGTDTAVRSADGGSFTVTDATTGFAEYRAPSADSFLVRPFSASTDVAALLSDVAVTDFDALSSGLPAANMDVTAGYQWKDRVIPPGATREFSVRVAANTSPTNATTSTTLTSALNPSTAGGAVSLIASVTGVNSGGDVQFKDGGVNVGPKVPIADGLATIDIPGVSAGTHSYTAVYSGTTDTAGSTSAVLSQSVAGQADLSQSIDCPPTTTPGASLVCTLTSNHVTGGPGQALTVQLALPAGTTFTSATGSGWDCFFMGQLTCTRPVLATGNSSAITLTLGVSAGATPGPRTLTAVLSASSDDLTPSNNTASDPVTVLAGTSTTVGSSASPATAGDAVTLTATVSEAQPSAPTGTVQFKDGTTDLGAPVALTAGGTAALTTADLTAGSHSITAVYSGDAAFSPSTSPAFSQVISPPAEGTPGPTPSPEPSPTATATPSPSPAPTATPGTGGGPGGGGQGQLTDPGISLKGVQKRVTLSSKGAFGLRFGATGGVPLSVDVTAVVPGTKKKGKRKATKAKVVKLYAGRGVAADSKGNVAVRVTLAKAVAAKLPKSRKSFAATLTVKANGRTLTHKFTLVRAKAKAKRKA